LYGHVHRQKGFHVSDRFLAAHFTTEKRIDAVDPVGENLLIRGYKVQAVVLIRESDETEGKVSRTFPAPRVPQMRTFLSDHQLFDLANRQLVVELLRLVNFTAIAVTIQKGILTIGQAAEPELILYALT
jgi:hypothetical protein